MKIQNINTINNNVTFAMDFKLSGKTLDVISHTTGLSKDELFKLSLDDASKLMAARGNLKQTNKFKQWLSDVYKIFGVKMGFIQKEYHIYSDGD